MMSQERHHCLSGTGKGWNRDEITVVLLKRIIYIDKVRLVAIQPLLLLVHCFCELKSLAKGKFWWCSAWFS